MASQKTNPSDFRNSSSYKRILRVLKATITRSTSVPNTCERQQAIMFFLLKQLSSLKAAAERTSLTPSVYCLKANTNYKSRTLEETSAKCSMKAAELQLKRWSCDLHHRPLVTLGLYWWLPAAATNDSTETKATISALPFEVPFGYSTLYWQPDVCGWLSVGFGFVLGAFEDLGVT